MEIKKDKLELAKTQQQLTKVLQLLQQQQGEQKLAEMKWHERLEQMANVHQHNRLSLLPLFGSPNVERIPGAELMAELVGVEVMKAGAVVADGEKART